MGSFSIWHWLVVLAVILVLFGGGNKISGLMGDFAKGIKSFKKNMAEPDDASMEEASAKPGGTIAGPEATPASARTRETSATH
jgi:sec-independent protein translocase protein TatA